MCTLSVSNVIYHKFSHGADFYTLNGKNINVMLELGINANQYLYVFRIVDVQLKYMCYKGEIYTNFLFVFGKTLSIFDCI